MSFSLFRTATVAALLAICLPARAAIVTGCLNPQGPVNRTETSDCANEDFGNRHTSEDPTDPSKWSNDKIGAGPLVESYLKSAQKYIDDKKFDLALDQAKKALQNSASDYEKLKSNQFLILANIDMNDTAAATIAAEAAADLQSIPQNEQADIYTNAAILADAAGHFDKAANYARKMQALKLSDDRSQRIINKALLDQAKIAKP